LPAHPSLEHLRKEAKQQLVQLRSRSQATQLADAQLLVARTYGYSSWRAMKDEVDRRRGVVDPPSILGDFIIPRPQRATRHAVAKDTVEAEQTLFRFLILPFLALPAAQGISLIIASLLG
jgi:hypothetical protein